MLDFPGGSDGKASAYNAGDLGSIPGSGRFPGERNGNPLQYSCLENPMDRGAWCRLLSVGSQSRTRLSDFTFTNGIWDLNSLTRDLTCVPYIGNTESLTLVKVDHQGSLSESYGTNVILIDLGR